MFTLFKTQKGEDGAQRKVRSDSYKGCLVGNKTLTCTQERQAGLPRLFSLGEGTDIDRPLSSELEHGGGGWGRLSRSSAGTCTTKKLQTGFVFNDCSWLRDPLARGERLSLQTLASSPAGLGEGDDQPL